MTYLSPYCKRVFSIPLSGSVADPAWLISCFELDLERNSVIASFTDFTILKQVIRDCEDSQLRQAAEMRGRQQVLDELGIGPEEYFRLRDAHKKQIESK